MRCVLPHPRALVPTGGQVNAHRWDERFFDTTRGRVLTLLRRGSRTIDDIAAALGLTDNAVRIHVAALQRDGIVRQGGVRPTGGKPAHVYEVSVEAERLFTRAYLPVLTEMVTVLEDRLGPVELQQVLRDVGRRLGASSPAATGPLRERAE